MTQLSPSQEFLVSPDELFDSLQDISSSTLNADSTPAYQPTNVVAPSTFVATDMEEIPGVLSPGQVKGLADLSIPESFSQIPQVDPLADLVARYFHRQERPTRNPALRSMVDGEDYELAIPEMLRNHTWYALATYTESQLTRSRPRDVEGLFKLWYFRILALVRLRFFQIAHNELEKLGSLNRPEFCYESHPLLFPGRQGSMVPFELRLLHAQLPGTLGNAHLSLDRVYDLILLVKTNIAKLERLATTGFFPYLPVLKGLCLTGADSLREAVGWRERETPLMMLSTRYLMELRDFTAAATQLRRIADMNPSNAAYLSFCGRMHLQLGDLLEGEHLFNHIQRLSEADQIMNAFNA